MKQFANALFCLLVIIVAGCGPSNSDRAQSQVSSIASKDFNDTNFPEGGKTGAVDPWGKEITWEMNKDVGIWHHDLVVRSAGPDGLPHTGDDLTATKQVRVAQRDDEGVAERGARGVIRGAIKGVKQGLSWSKEDDERNPDAAPPKKNTGENENAGKKPGTESGGDSAGKNAGK